MDLSGVFMLQKIKQTMCKSQYKIAIVQLKSSSLIQSVLYGNVGQTCIKCGLSPYMEKIPEWSGSIGYMPQNSSKKNLNTKLGP